MTTLKSSDVKSDSSINLINPNEQTEYLRPLVKISLQHYRYMRQKATSRG